MSPSSDPLRDLSSAVDRPPVLLARLPGGAALTRAGAPLWTSLDGTSLGDALGSFSLAFGRAPA